MSIWSSDSSLEDVWQDLETVWVVTIGEMQLVSSGYRPGMLRNIYSARDGPTALDYLAPSVSSTEVENPGLDIKELDSFPKTKCELYKKASRVSPRQCGVGSLADAKFLSPLGKQTGERACISFLLPAPRF